MTSKRLRPFPTLLSGAALAMGASLALPAQAEELRIGFLVPTTGIFAQIGKDMTDGFQLYLDAHKGELGGAKVKLVIEDTMGKPDIAVTRMRKVILQDKVNMVIGGVLASEGYAMAPVSTEYKTLYISSVQAADDLTQRQLSEYPYFIRTSWTSSQPSHPFGQWACDQGFKKVAAIGADYAFGYEVIGGSNYLILHDKNLYPDDLVLAGLRADLVVVNACSSGVIPRAGRNADQALGLPAALLYGGARQVVGTIWPVETEPALDFAVKFYDEWQQRPQATTAEIVINVQKQLRTKFDDVFAWGAYSVFGDWR